MRYSQPYHDAVAIQRVLMKHAIDPETPAGYAAQVARAWDVLEERKRVMKMRPRPRDIDTTKNPQMPKTKRAKGESAFSEKAEGIS